MIICDKSLHYYIKKSQNKLKYSVSLTTYFASEMYEFNPKLTTATYWNIHMSQAIPYNEIRDADTAEMINKNMISVAQKAGKLGEFRLSVDDALGVVVSEVYTTLKALSVKDPLYKDLYEHLFSDEVRQNENNFDINPVSQSFDLLKAMRSNNVNDSTKQAIEESTYRLLTTKNFGQITLSFFDGVINNNTNPNGNFGITITDQRIARQYNNREIVSSDGKSLGKYNPATLCRVTANNMFALIINESETDPNKPQIHSRSVYQHLDAGLGDNIHLFYTNGSTTTNSRSNEKAITKIDQAQVSHRLDKNGQIVSYITNGNRFYNYHSDRQNRKDYFDENNLPKPLAFKEKPLAFPSIAPKIRNNEISSSASVSTYLNNANNVSLANIIEGLSKHPSNQDQQTLGNNIAVNAYFGKKSNPLGQYGFTGFQKQFSLVDYAIKTGAISLASIPNREKEGLNKFFPPNSLYNQAVFVPAYPLNLDPNGQDIVRKEEQAGQLYAEKTNAGGEVIATSKLSAKNASSSGMVHLAYSNIPENLEDREGKQVTIVLSEGLTTAFALAEMVDKTKMFDNCVVLSCENANNLVKVAEILAEMQSDKEGFKKIMNFADAQVIVAGDNDIKLNQNLEDAFADNLISRQTYNEAYTANQFGKTKDGKPMYDASGRMIAPTYNSNGQIVSNTGVINAYKAVDVLKAGGVTAVAVFAPRDELMNGNPLSKNDRQMTEQYGIVLTYEDNGAINQYKGKYSDYYDSLELKNSQYAKQVIDFVGGQDAWARLLADPSKKDYIATLDARAYQAGLGDMATTFYKSLEQANRLSLDNQKLVLPDFDPTKPFAKQTQSPSNELKYDYQDEINFEELNKAKGKMPSVLECVHYYLENQSKNNEHFRNNEIAIRMNGFFSQYSHNGGVLKGDNSDDKRKMQTDINNTAKEFLKKLERGKYDDTAIFNRAFKEFERRVESGDLQGVYTKRSYNVLEQFKDAQAVYLDFEQKGEKRNQLVSDLRETKQYSDFLKGGSPHTSNIDKTELKALIISKEGAKKEIILDKQDFMASFKEFQALSQNSDVKVYTHSGAMANHLTANEMIKTKTGAIHSSWEALGVIPIEEMKNSNLQSASLFSDRNSSKDLFIKAFEGSAIGDKANYEKSVFLMMGAEQEQAKKLHKIYAYQNHNGLTVDEPALKEVKNEHLLLANEMFDNAKLLCDKMRLDLPENAKMDTMTARGFEGFREGFRNRNQNRQNPVIELAIQKLADSNPAMVERELRKHSKGADIQDRNTALYNLFAYREDGIGKVTQKDSPLTQALKEFGTKSDAELMQIFGNKQDVQDLKNSHQLVEMREQREYHERVANDAQGVLTRHKNTGGMPVISLFGYQATGRSSLLSPTPSNLSDEVAKHISPNSQTSLVVSVDNSAMEAFLFAKLTGNKEMATKYGKGGDIYRAYAESQNPKMNWDSLSKEEQATTRDWAKKQVLTNQYNHTVKDIDHPDYQSPINQTKLNLERFLNDPQGGSFVLYNNLDLDKNGKPTAMVAITKEIDLKGNTNLVYQYGVDNTKQVYPLKNEGGKMVFADSKKNQELHGGQMMAWAIQGTGTRINRLHTQNLMALKESRDNEVNINPIASIHDELKFTVDAKDPAKFEQALEKVQTIMSDVGGIAPKEPLEQVVGLNTKIAIAQDLVKQEQDYATPKQVIEANQTLFQELQATGQSIEQEQIAYAKQEMERQQSLSAKNNEQEVEIEQENRATPPSPKP